MDVDAIVRCEMPAQRRLVGSFTGKNRVGYTITISSVFYA